MPVRGMLVRLTDAWQDILARRAANTATGAYPQPVRQLLGEMAAAGVLMQGNIKFNGALILQIFGDGPVKVGVVEVQPDFSLRATCTQVGDVAEDASLSQMVNVNNQGRCAITLDPKDRLPGQQQFLRSIPVPCQARSVRYRDRWTLPIRRLSRQRHVALAPSHVRSRFLRVRCFRG